MDLDSNFRRNNIICRIRAASIRYAGCCSRFKSQLLVVIHVIINWVFSCRSSSAVMEALVQLISEEHSVSKGKIDKIYP